MATINIQILKNFIDIEDILIDGVLLSKKDISTIKKYAKEGEFSIFPKTRDENLKNIAFHLENPNEDNIIIEKDKEGIKISKGVNTYIASILRKDEQIDIYVKEDDENLNKLLGVKVNIIENIEKKLSLSAILNNENRKDEIYYLKRILIHKDSLKDIPTEIWDSPFFCSKIANSSKCEDELNEDFLFNKGFIELLNDDIFISLWKKHYSSLYSAWKEDAGGFISNDGKKAKEAYKRKQIQDIFEMDSKNLFYINPNDNESISRYKQELMQEALMELDFSVNEYSSTVKAKAKIFFDSFEAMLKNTERALSLLNEIKKQGYKNDDLLSMIIRNNIGNDEVLKKALLQITYYKLEGYGVESGSLMSYKEIESFVKNNKIFCFTILLDGNPSLFNNEGFKKSISNYFSDEDAAIKLFDEISHQAIPTEIWKKIYNLNWKENNLKNNDNIVTYLLDKCPSIYENLSTKNSKKLKYLDKYLDLPSTLINLNEIPKEVLFSLKNPEMIEKCLSKKGELINIIPNWLSVENLIKHKFNLNNIKNKDTLLSVISQSKDIATHEKLLEQDINYYPYVNEVLKNDKKFLIEYIENNGDNFKGVESAFYSKKFCQEVLEKENFHILNLIPSVFWDDVSFVKEVLIKIDEKKVNSKIISHIPILSELFENHSKKEISYEKFLLKNILDYDLNNHKSKKMKPKI